MNMRSPVLATLVLAFLAINAYSQTPYDESANYAALQGKFDIYQKDVQRLQQQVDTLKTKVADAQTSTTLQLAAYQETIAQERDILYNIQSYLRLPLNVSRCNCYNFTSEQKDGLNSKIKSLNASLQRLGSNSVLKVQCNDSEEIKRQIKAQVIYLNSVNEAVNSNCCRTKSLEPVVPLQNTSGIVDISNHTFQTNLKANNFIYGGLNPDQVRLMYFSRASTQNVSNCALSTPFWDGTNCIDCQLPNQYWNLSSSQCVTCKQFDAAARNCLDKITIGLEEVWQVTEPIFQSQTQSQTQTETQNYTNTQEIQVVAEPIYGDAVTQQTTVTTTEHVYKPSIQPKSHRKTTRHMNHRQH